jgi:hypothetical protein
LPRKPNAPYKSEEESSMTSIMINWDLSPPVDNVDINGYILYMDDGYNGNFDIIYNGIG